MGFPQAGLVSSEHTAQTRQKLVDLHVQLGLQGSKVMCVCSEIGSCSHMFLS